MSADNASVSDLQFYFDRLRKNLRSRWKLSLLIIAASALCLLAVSFLIKPTYTASASLYIEGNKGQFGGLAGYMELAGSLGILGGGGIAVDEDKLMELLKSRRIMYAALLSKASIDDKTDLLANHYLTANGFYTSNEGYKDLSVFRFTHTKPQDLTFREDSILSQLYKKIVSDELVVSKLPKSGIISVVVKMRSEPFAAAFAGVLIDEVSRYYMEHKTSKELYAVNVIQSRVDSIKEALDLSEGRIAAFKDASFGLVKAKGLRSETHLHREAQILNVMYGEAIKNLELAKFNLLLSTPVLQVVDLPKLPLEKNVFSKTTAVLMGLLLGFGIVLFYLLYRDQNQ